MASAPLRRSRRRPAPAFRRLAAAAACALVATAALTHGLPAEAGPRRGAARRPAPGRSHAGTRFDANARSDAGAGPDANARRAKFDPSNPDPASWDTWNWGPYDAAGPAAAEWFLGGDGIGADPWPGGSAWSDAPPVATPGAALRTTVGPSPTYVHLDVAAGSVVRLDVLRVTGTLPDLLWVEDLEGRVWTPAVVRTAKSLATEEIFAPAAGGLYAVLSPTRTAVAQTDLLVSARDLAPGESAPVAETPWAPGVLTAPYDGSMAGSDPGGNCPPPFDPTTFDPTQFDPTSGEPWWKAWGDPAAWAADQGFAWLTAGDGVLVLGMPGCAPGLEWRDAADLAGTCGPWLEPDALADLPETSQRNQLIVGSEFGRGYPVQPAIRSIFTPPPGRGGGGAGVTIAVIDTGVDASHPAFAGRVLPGRDFVGGDDDASDERNGTDDDGDGDVDGGFGHGTVVAGIALAVAPEARILPVRVLDDEGRGTASRVAQGIRWAADHGANVVNLSLGTRAWSTVLARAVSDAVDRGVLVCVAAGNDGDRWSLDFPADVPGVAAITALGVRGRRAVFGNGNRTTTIAAPGVRVIGPYPGGTFAAGTGTSFAAPLASGAAALLLQVEPGASIRDLRTKLAPRSRLDLRPLPR